VDPVKHHKPLLTDPAQIDAASSESDPMEIVEAAHRTAAVVVGRGREGDDPELTRRLVGLVEEVGLSTVAEMWAGRPARSLPGALWRLYLLHEWVQRDPVEVSRAFEAGAAHADVYRVIAGVAEPPSPEDLVTLTRRILQGVFDGDLAVALERASAFCHVVAVGLADPAAGTDDVPRERVQQAARMQSTAEDLQACGRLWRRQALV
jgi:hypothetical protein